MIGKIAEMNSSDQQKFSRRLLALRDDLASQDGLGQSGQKPVVLDQQSVGRLSRMDALQQQAMAKATQIRRNQQKQRIDVALSRIKEGEFGYCVSCGSEIAAKRLELDPSLPTCLSCASGN